MNFQADILAVQHRLNELGHHRVNEDGLAGPRTWMAIAWELGLGIEEVPRDYTDIIAAAQRHLSKLTFYKGRADGIAGRLTWDAICRALDVPAQPPIEMPPPVPSDIPLAGNVDARSEHAIATLHPHTQSIARLFVLKCNSSLAPLGLHVVITSATRTYAEQAELYAQGRTKPGKIVTKAPPGFSNHNFGIAFDVTLFNGGSPLWESPLYRNRIAPIGKKLGLTWGGDWESINDEPHYEDKPDWARNISEKQMLAEMRRRKNIGKDAFEA